MSEQKTEIDLIKSKIKENLHNILEVTVENFEKLPKEVFYTLIFSTALIDYLLDGNYQKASEYLNHIKSNLERLAEKEGIDLEEEEE